MLCGNHLNTVKKTLARVKTKFQDFLLEKNYHKARMGISNAALRNSVGAFRVKGRESPSLPQLFLGVNFPQFSDIQKRASSLLSNYDGEPARTVDFQ